MKFKLEGSDWAELDQPNQPAGDENTADNNVVNPELEKEEEGSKGDPEKDITTSEEEDVLKFKDEEEVLNYIKSKEDLVSKLSVREESAEVPDDIKKYLEFKKETGRSYSDFIEYQKDFSATPKEELVKKFIRETNPEYDELDVEEEFSEMYSFDDEFDDEKTINKKTRALKKSHKEALEYFESQKEKWSVPLGSNENTIPEEYKQAKAALEKLSSEVEENQQKSNYFLSKTEELFSSEFKGFEFKIGNEVIVQKPENLEALKETQKDVSNFFKKFLDEKGLIKDPEGYHKALYVAMNYESILKDVYDTAVAKAIESEVKNSKNIDMSLRPSQETIRTGTKFKLV